MSTQGSLNVDFGTGATDKVVEVSAPTITGTQLVDAWVMPTATATNTADDSWVDDLIVSAGAISAGAITGSSVLTLGCGTLTGTATVAATVVGAINWKELV